MKHFVLGGVLFSLALAIFLSPWASSSPDGLERIAEDKGFIERAVEDPALPSPLPDYTVPGIGKEGFSTAFAGLIGTLICFGAALGLGWTLKSRKKNNPNQA